MVLNKALLAMVRSYMDHMVVASGRAWAAPLERSSTILSAQRASASPLHQEVVPGPLSTYPATTSTGPTRSGSKVSLQCPCTLLLALIILTAMRLP